MNTSPSTITVRACLFAFATLFSIGCAELGEDEDDDDGGEIAEGQIAASVSADTKP